MSAALVPWEHPDCYIGKRWNGWLMFLSQTRDSDALDRSNFIVGLEAVEKATSLGREDFEHQPLRVQENHWACGWIEWIAIHQSDAGAITCAQRLIERLEQYPILNEDHMSQLEADERIDDDPGDFSGLGECDE